MTSSALRITVCAALVLGAIPGVSAGPNPVTSTHGSPTHLSQQQRAHVLDGDYTLLRRVADLPPSVKLAFASGHFEMADPGQEYQATDVVRPGTHLPRRRLVLAGCVESRCFIHYEKGGIGHAYYVVVFDIAAESASFLWGGAGFKGASELAALRSKVRSGEQAGREGLGVGIYLRALALRSALESSGSPRGRAFTALRRAQDHAKARGLDKLSRKDIDAEIKAARAARGRRG